MNVKLVSAETSVELCSILSPELSLLLKYKQVIFFLNCKQNKQKTSFTVSEAVGHFTALDLYFSGAILGFLILKINWK